MTMYGASVADMRAAAQQLTIEADQLDASQNRLTTDLGAMRWLGAVAVRFSDVWATAHKPRMAVTADFLRVNADILRRQADEQQGASDGAGTGATYLASGTIVPCVDAGLGSLEPSRHVMAIPMPRDGREVVIEALHGTADGRRTESDEIEIRKLENGRYVVVLPGVTDLSSAGGELRAGFVDGLTSPGPVGLNAGIGAIHGVDRAIDGWYDNNDPVSVRKMKYAIEVARNPDFVNPYSERVIQQMRAAGIPQGAEVMLVGHSYGAYTAMDLAGNPKFNSIDGVGEGYSVRVTHVVAAGADTDWMLSDVPPATHALILNNKQDAVVNAENLIHSDADPQHPGHVDIRFNNNPSAGLKGSGHHPDNYTSWLSKADRPELKSWLADVGEKYTSPGVAYSVRVPDEATP